MHQIINAAIQLDANAKNKGRRAEHANDKPKQCNYGDNYYGDQVCRSNS